MPKPAKQQSNPYSTGGGGSNFETRVQAAFAVLMLTGRIAPCLPPFPITKIKLQARYTGVQTDDFIVFAKQPETEQEAKLLVQVKHDLSITEGDTTFAEVIQSNWNDFNSESFDSSVDAIALVTGPLSATDIDDVRPILEWARHSEDETEFFTKIKTANFSSDAKRKKLAAFKIHLKNANEGIDVTDRQVWEFLKVFHLIGYDLDTESGSTLSLLHSLIAQYSNEAAPSVWARVVDAVQISNQNAGTIALETLPEDIRTKFSTAIFSSWLSDLNKLRDHGNFILGGIRTTIGRTHIKQSEAFDRLLDLAETSSFIFVSGERGAGKSSLVRKFSDYMGERAPIFCLRTEDLDRSHLDNVFSAMGLKGSLRELEAGFALMPKKYLLIESLEKLLELEKTTAFIDLLHLLNKQQGWTIIATGRDYAYQQITFTYLQPHGIKFTPLTLNGFSNEQVRDLCEQIEALQKFSNNPNLRILLKSPFFADLACRVLETGTEFTHEDGEKEFRDAVWRDAIAKEQERANGMPTKRRQTFIDIAVRRAKQMVYGVPETLFDENAVFKLEEDNLVRRDSKNGLVSPAHDVLEDWALDRYIEEIYQQHSGNIQNFLNAIGNEPAINRAFRLWLHQKLRYGDNVDNFVLAILTDRDIQRYWQDETIAAILQGDNPSEFLNLLKSKLFLEDGELLKRFCFILRLVCQMPDLKLIPKLEENDGMNLVDALYLKPYGKAWETIICFLFENRKSLSKDLTPHITAILNDWSSLLNLNEELPVPAREVGLLSLHLLTPLKELYQDDGNRKKLLSIIIKTIPAIHQEFTELLETDVLVYRSESHRLSYVKQFCKMSLGCVESAFFSKYAPNQLMKLAYFEWFEETVRDRDNGVYRRTSPGALDKDRHFGLKNDGNMFFPASGAKGLFNHLLRFHPHKGLKFILELLNKTVEIFTHPDLYLPGSYSSRVQELSESVFEPLTIQLNNGGKVYQYYSGDFWSAYRGFSNIPYLLQCALMALENSLIAHVESCEPGQLEWLFDYILRNSNSVMTTAVLASIAMGFPAKVGKSALPLLRTRELYRMDLARTIHERGGSEINWHYSGFQRDALSKVYAEERRTAALRPWRKESLETLVTRLQFSEWRDETLTAINLLRASEPQDETIRFLLHRIDSRGWNPVEDRENNRIIFEPENLEADLKDSQQQTQERMREQNRFIKLDLWSRSTFAREPLETEYYATWIEALAEAKELFEKLNAGTVSDLAAMSFGGIVTAAAIFVRDYSGELTDEDVAWSFALIGQTVLINADVDDSIGSLSYADTASSASVLPIFLDLFSEENDRYIVKSLIITALTHTNKEVRHKAADGIRNYLWQRDPEFAQECITGSLEYARFDRDKDNQCIKRQIYNLSDDAREIEISKLQAKKDEFRERFKRGELSSDLNLITLRSHSSRHILSPCLMIPNASKESSNIKLWSKMLSLLFEAEQQEDRQDSKKEERVEIDVDISLNFTNRFAEYLFQLHDSNFEDYIEQLRMGCEIAPDFMSYFISCIALEAEKRNKNEVYWQLWKELSPKVQEIAIAVARNNSEYRQRDNRQKLIRSMLHADTPWQKLDYENQDIGLGKDSILEFVTNTGKNPDVFESLASLMHHFPSIFFESGVRILAKHQREEGTIRLLSGVNTSFYLERAIQHFLLIDRTGSLTKTMHESCFILLDAIVETASSRAYYLREHLIRSRRIV
ncbi:ATP-binding protein [Chamaesiphon minutus]|uniref:ATP-binding protein n=1 Tax=Chamaesiphon minutus (strain ATCC 27169 / PCC 6605) TaxID=1173020 RepID=K9UEU2_CHAP6|nr:ATP-binding protein [Chamaesiphon minutus]AFY93168.1 hypothetical protein Cha6605_2073 [Chamaesiphon minutus PCC 6605]